MPYWDLDDAYHTIMPFDSRSIVAGVKIQKDVLQKPIVIVAFLKQLPLHIESASFTEFLLRAKCSFGNPMTTEK